ncbi:MAG: nodulation protein NfeD [Nitrospirota bacterium]
MAWDGPIGPATADYLHRGLARAHARGTMLVILRLDTPGGLDSATRAIIKDILASPVPVATFVAPSGARAASAGTYILYASHIAAMAPGTNLGAATPVQIGAPAPGSEEPAPGKRKPTRDESKEESRQSDDKDQTVKPGMEEKALNDAIAYIRGLAQLRGRNVEWAERAVRTAASLPADEAVTMNVADLMATDVPDLLTKLDGRSVTIDGRAITLSTTAMQVDAFEPDWRNRLLSVITDPNIAYILLLLGVYGLFFELWNPGYVLPGVMGGICLLLALYAFQVLPISYAGLGLILLGIAFMVGEAFLPSFGALGIGGVIAFVVGSIILMDTDVEGYTVAWPLVLTVAALSAAFFTGVVTLALKARRRAVVSGAEELLGASGVALEAFADAGRIRIHSEEWQARTRVPVAAGQRVRVIGRDGLVLVVEPLNTEGR